MISIEVDTMNYQSTHVWQEELWEKAREIYFEAFEGHGGKPEKLIRNMFQTGQQLFKYMSSFHRKSFRMYGGSSASSVE